MDGHALHVIGENLVHGIKLARKRIKKLKEGNFEISDENGNMVMVNISNGLTRDMRVLMDSSGTPLLTLREKISTMHHRWQVFRGGSMEEGDLLYTVKRPSMFFQYRTKLDVFWSHNTEEKTCDFRVRENSDDIVFYAGESDAIVAQVDTKGKVNYS